MMKVPRVTIWRERIDGTASVVHAVRNWDVPSNGVFMLIVSADWQTWDNRSRLMKEITEKLQERELRLFREFGRLWRHHLCHYFDDEVWCGDTENT